LAIGKRGRYNWRKSTGNTHKCGARSHCDCSIAIAKRCVCPDEKRIALLIGNRAYDTSVGAFKNPHNDIAIVGEALSKQAFGVLPPIKDARRSAILGGVRDLVRRLNAAGSWRGSPRRRQSPKHIMSRVTCAERILCARGSLMGFVPASPRAPADPSLPRKTERVLAETLNGPRD
jgi:hypothetical protein